MNKNTTGKSRVNLLEALSSREPRTGRTSLIAVDGHGGSGKTTFAKWLSGLLGAEQIHTDDFSSWDNFLNWLPLFIEQIIAPMTSGAKTLSYPRSKWWDDHHPEPVVNQPVTDIMILEGVGSSRKELRNYLSLSIFIETPKEMCILRGVERDSGTGKSKEQLIAIWEQWFAKEVEYMLRHQPKTYSDIVIDGTKPFELQIG